MIKTQQTNFSPLQQPNEKTTNLDNDAESSTFSYKDDYISPIRKRRNIKVFGYEPHLYLLLLIEFCERFSFYGIRSVLAVYLTNEMGLTQAKGSEYYHYYIVLCYTTPIIGGIVADQFWGKYKTIFLLSIVYAVGNGVISAGSVFVSGSGISLQQILTYMGLFLVGVGTGGIKPCVSAFCGDQIDSNHKRRGEKLEKFFSLFYICINLGAVISSYLTPILRQKECLDKESCYIAAFGLPSVLMVTALLLFISGKRFYTINQPRGSVFIDFIKTTLGTNKEQITPLFKKQTQRVHKIISFILPVLIFWAVFDLAGSVLTYQAGQLNRSVPYALKFLQHSGWWAEDQIEAINPVLIIPLTLIFSYIVYPFVNKFIRATALRKMLLGLILNVLVCFCAMKLQHKIDADFTYVAPEYNTKNLSPVKASTFIFQYQFPIGKNQTIVYKNFDNYDDNRVEPTEISVKSGSVSPRFWTWFSEEKQYESIYNPKNYTKELEELKEQDKSEWEESLPYVTFVSNKNEILMKSGFNKIITFNDGLSTVVYPSTKRPANGFSQFNFYSRTTDKKEFLKKLESFNCKLADEQSQFHWIGAEHQNISEKNIGKQKMNVANLLISNQNEKETQDDVIVQSYEVPQYSRCQFNDEKEEIEVGANGIYSRVNFGNNIWSEHTVDLKPLTHHVCWQVALYCVSTISEILISISGLEYSYAQAPQNLKSVVSAIWLIPVALGNIYTPMTLKMYDVKLHAWKLHRFNMFVAAGGVIWFIFAISRYIPAEEEEEEDGVLTKEGNVNENFSESDADDTQKQRPL